MADGESGAKALNASRMNSAGGLEFAPEIAAALNECVSSAELSWLALGYESKKALKLLATGSSGGYAALKPHLADDAVVYSAFKVACAGSQKLVFLSSIGPNAGGMASRHQHSNQYISRPRTPKNCLQLQRCKSFLHPLACCSPTRALSLLLCLPVPVPVPLSLSLLECLLASRSRAGRRRTRRSWRTPSKARPSAFRPRTRRTSSPMPSRPSSRKHWARQSRCELQRGRL